MRKYTFELLKGFYKLCQNRKNKTALKRRGFGVAIAINAGFDIKLKSQDGSYSTDSPVFSEISGAFEELLEKGWIEEIQISEDDEFFHFNDYKEYLMKSGLPMYSNPVNIKNELSHAPWPLGNHWFLLTAKGEEYAQKETLNVFPFIPDKVKETLIHQIENDEMQSDKEFNGLLNFMFKHQEREFYIYLKNNEKLNDYFQNAKNKNDILIDGSEMFYYRHPQNSRNFVQVSGGIPKNDIQKKIIENSSMYKKIKISLTEEIKRRLTYRAMGGFLGKIGLVVAIVSVLMAGGKWAWDYSVHLESKTNTEKNIFKKEQQIAFGLYPELLTMRNQIERDRRKIDISGIQGYFESGQYLPADIHTQLSNLMVSVKAKNYKAVKAQVDDIISKIEKQYGCRKVDDKSILVGNTISADTNVVE